MDVARILESVARFAWPAIATVLLWRLFPIIRDIARSRAFSVKVGEMQVSVQDASEQLRQQIEDLQQKVSELRTQHRLTAIPEASNTYVDSVPSAVPERLVQTMAPHVLWVDDDPTNHVYEIARLRDAGVEVSEVMTTDETLRLEWRSS